MFDNMYRMIIIVAYYRRVNLFSEQGNCSVFKLSSFDYIYHNYRAHHF